MNTFKLVQRGWNFCHILRAAFAGQWVPKDLSNEPASVLLKRIRAGRVNREGAKKPRGRKAKEAA